MRLAEDLKALQELREKGELSESAYQSARDAIVQKQGVAPTVSPKTSQNTSMYVLLILLAAVFVIAVLFAIDRVTKRTKPPDVPHTGFASSIPYLTPQPQPHVVAITNGALTVGAHAVSWYTFSVPVNATNVFIDGHFTATGGIGNDIIVYVADQDGLANIQNGHQAQVFFNSQKVTQSGIHAVLPNAPGTYYLVFDNRFSLITPKAVEVSATLNYLQ